MQQDPLKSGDRVIELASLAVSVAVVAGALSTAVCARLAGRSWLSALGALVFGGLLGYLAGLVTGRIFYRTADGQTAVVRVGRAALPAAQWAGVSTGLVSALASTGLLVWWLAAPLWPALIASACCGLLAGLVLSCLASFT
jgi:hypothetical protein